MRKQVLINVEETDVRVAMLEDGTLVELFVEDMASRSKIGNIYKGRVEGIIPGLKAVFVNIGLEKNAFLHFSDVLPEFELPMRGRPERSRPVKSAEAIAPDADSGTEEDDYIESAIPTEHVEPERPKPRSRQLQVGDEMLVQVTKEEISTKGPRVTGYVSLPGRYLVLMPYADSSGGVSRRIEDADERKRLRRILKEMQPERGSFIIRTAGLEQDEDAIRKDAEMLKETWHSVMRRSGKCRAPARVYDDQEILTRMARDNFSDDIDEILVDKKSAMRELIKTCQMLTPEIVSRIHYYDSPKSIFDTFEVEQQFQKALRRKVWLRSGGAIIIDETEALTAIDVNTGKYVGKDDQESAILKTNLEACRGVARQLRLRDLGGLVVIDFIDMAHRENELQVLRELKRCLRQDRAKFAISDFSNFGLVELTRKRVRKSLASSLYRPCPYCEGSSRIMNESFLWKHLKYELIPLLEKQPRPGSVDILVHSQFKTYLQQTMTDGLAMLAGRYQVALNIIGSPDFHHEEFKFVSHEATTVKEDAKPDSAAKRGRRTAAEKKLETVQSAPDNAS